MKHSLATSSMIENAGPRSFFDAEISSKTSSSTSLSLKILMVLIGSPTYFGSLKRVVFTSPAPRSNRHGITRVLNMLNTAPRSFAVIACRTCDFFPGGTARPKRWHDESLNEKLHHMRWSAVRPLPADI